MVFKHADKSVPSRRMGTDTVTGGIVRQMLQGGTKNGLESASNK